MHKEVNFIHKLVNRIKRIFKDKKEPNQAEVIGFGNDFRLKNLAFSPFCTFRQAEERRLLHLSRKTITIKAIN